MDAALQAQAMARNNAEDMGFYMKDLLSWEKAVKVTDTSLTLKKSAKKSLPPVRNSEGATKAARAKIAKSTSKPAEKPIPGGDFRAWDKYDVDKALEDADAEEDTDAVTEAHRAMQLQEHLGNAEKDKGNEQFKQGKFAAAIACYTRGIEYDPFNPALVANRAMANLKMKNYADAEADSTAAIELDKRYLKAWQRRATARSALGKLADSLADHQQVLKLDPVNKASAAEVKALPGRIKAEEEKKRKAFRPLEHIGDSTTMSSQRRSTAMHRIEIEEIGSSDDEEAPPVSPSAVTPTITTPAAVLSGKKVLIESDSSSGEEDNEKALVSPPTSSWSLDAQAAGPAVELKAPSLRHGHQARVSTTSGSPRSAQDMSGKMTSVTFDRGWRKVLNDDDGLFSFLKKVDPAALPGLAKNNLDPAFVSAAIRVLASRFLPSATPYYNFLSGLAKTARFDQTVMFLEDDEVALVAQLFEALSNGTIGAADASPEDIVALAAAYNCG